MAKVIIGIHGLSNKPKKELLEKWWKRSIIEGLKNYYGDDLSDIKFELVYWADVLYENPLDERIKDPGHPLFLDEPYTKGLSKRKYSVKEKKKKANKSILRFFSRFLLNKDLTINYSYFTDVIVHRYYKDLEAYYYKKKNVGNEEFYVKELIRRRLIRLLKKHGKDDILLLAHSMGSIIALDVLYSFEKEFSIHTLVTLGSPLAFPVVIGKIAEEIKKRQPGLTKLKTPEPIKFKWFNFSDIEDKVAVYDRLSDDFDENGAGVKVVDMEVYNDYRINKQSNPHKSFGYLRTEEIAKVVFEFVAGGGAVLKKRLRFRLLRFLIDIKIKTNKK